MQKIKSICLFSQILILQSLCAMSSINPANYIWIDYQAQVALKPKAGGDYAATLPCQARIGKCSYQFTVLPPGWEIGRDGTLTIPRTDAIKNGSFAVEGKFSEATGEKIDANLVATIENGVLKVVDKREYYKKIGYNLPVQQGPIKTTNYEESILVKNLPSGFISIDSLQKELLLGNITNISSILNDIQKQYAPCRSKINYLNEVRGLLAKLIRNNTEQIRAHEESIRVLEGELRKLRDKREMEYFGKGVSQELNYLNNRVDSLNKELNKLKANETYYKDLAQQSINSFNAYPINVDSLSSPQLTSLINQIIQVSKELENSYNSSITTRKSLAEAKLNKEKASQPISVTSATESSFRVNTQLMINSLIYRINNDVKLDNFQFLKSEAEELARALDGKISELTTVEVRQSSDPAELAKKIYSENQMLSKNMDYLLMLSFSYNGCK